MTGNTWNWVGAYGEGWYAQAGGVTTVWQEIQGVPASFPQGGDTLNLVAGQAAAVVTTGAGAGDSVTLAGGTIFNRGQILINSSQAAGGFASLVIQYTVYLGVNSADAGVPGDILMSDNSHNAITHDGGGTVSTFVNYDNLISGAGSISVGAYVNGYDLKGTATVDANGLNAMVMSGTTDNFGLLESTNPDNYASVGGLVLSNATIDQTTTNYTLLGVGDAYKTPTGIVEANGAGTHVDLNGATIIGGQLLALNGGVINANSGKLDGSMTDGNGAAAPVTVGATINVATNGNLDLIGEIDFNQGAVVNVNATSALNSAINIDASAQSATTTLKGGAVINLADVANQRAVISVSDGYAVTLDNQITIQGAGYIGHYQGLLSLTNEATIDANGLNSLVIHTGSFVNAGGLLEATNTGGLALASTVDNQSGTIAAKGAGVSVYLQGGGIVQGGTVSTSGGGVVHIVGGGLDGSTDGAVDIAGAVQVDDNNNGVVTGTIDIAANATLTLVSAGSSNSTLNLTGPTTFSGAGAIVMSDAGGNRNVITDNGYSQTLTNETTIQGAGYVGQSNQVFSTLINKGTINANGAHNLLLNDYTLNNQGGALESTNTGGLTIQEGSFTNTGEVDAHVGMVSITGAVVNDDMLAATGGTLVVSQAVTGTGSAALSGGGVMTFEGAFNQAVTFSGAGSLLLSQNDAAAMTGFVSNDKIDLTYLSGGSIQNQFANGGDTIVLVAGTVNGQAVTEQFTFVGASLAGTFSAQPDTNSGTFLETTAPACFVRGSRILTDRGEVAVEDLRIGDLAITASGARRPIVWLGHRGIDIPRHPDPAAVRPVQVCAGAFGEGLPHRDPWLSPGHNVAWEGALMPISALVNGRSVVQIDRRRVEYWHVELDAHDILLAEGLPAESYLDCGNRIAFANGGAFIEAHPDFAPKYCAETCLPLVLDGPQVAAAKTHLLARLAARGCVLTEQDDAHIVADGRKIEPIRLSSTRLGFVLPESAKSIVLRSNTFAPAHSQPESRDKRELGLCVGRLQIDGSLFALDDEKAFGGWHAAEFVDMRFTHRWTSGHTPLPAGARTVIVDLAGNGYYWTGTDALTMSRPVRLAGQSRSGV